MSSETTPAAAEPENLLADLVDRVFTASREIRMRDHLDDGIIRVNESEGNIMRYLDRHPSSLPSDVARASGYQRSNLSATLKSLEAKGLLERRIDPDDSRQVRLFSTPLAAENLARLRHEWATIVSDALGGDLEGLEQCLAMLERVERGLVSHRLL